MLPAASAAPRRHTLALALALLAVAALRLRRLPEAGLPDYDSVRNWHTLVAMRGGDFRNLFLPGCPAFFLSYLPVAGLTTNFHVFQTLNALLAVAGLGAFARWVARHTHLSPALTAALVGLAGTSLLLTFSGRDFTPNSGSLLLLTGLLAASHRRAQHPTPAALLRVASWLALGLSYNYKFLFALPVLAALEWQRADGLLGQRGTWARVLAVLAAPYVLLGGVGVALGLPWHRWLGFYVRTALPVQAAVAGRHSPVRLDWAYYPHFLLTHDPLLLAGWLATLGALAALAWHQRSRWRTWRGQPLAVPGLLLMWATCWLLGMSLLAKAPRGLLLAYLPLAALAVLALRRWLPPPGRALVLAAALAWNVALLRNELYARLPSHYPQVAAWLQAHGAQRIASTVGQGLWPYLAPTQTLTVVQHEHQLTALRQQGYDYVLLDSYWRVAGIAGFDSLRQQPPAAAWPEPQLTAPLLFLEHSEFTNLGYGATLQQAQTAARDSVQLRLYKL